MRDKNDQSAFNILTSVAELNPAQRAWGGLGLGCPYPLDLWDLATR